MGVCSNVGINNVCMKLERIILLTSKCIVMGMCRNAGKMYEVADDHSFDFKHHTIQMMMNVKDSLLGLTQVECAVDELIF